jgi:hypothetical protein
VEHGEVGVGAFLPADEQSTEAVEPGLRALDDPAAGAEVGLVFNRLCLFAALADGRRRDLLTNDEREELKRLRKEVVELGGLDPGAAATASRAWRGDASEGLEGRACECFASPWRE